MLADAEHSLSFWSLHPTLTAPIAARRSRSSQRQPRTPRLPKDVGFFPRLRGSLLSRELLRGSQIGPGGFELLLLRGVRPAGNRLENLAVGILGREADEGALAEPLGHGTRKTFQLRLDHLVL